jgi:hypothetical protein
MVDHSARSHKRFAASAAEQWMRCPGSIRLCESIPAPPPTSYALEGTLAHEWLQYKLVGGVKPKQDATPEMLEAAEEFKTIVCSEWLGRVGSWMVEKEVVLDVHSDIGGTADLSAYNYDSRTMWVFDYKFGAGEIVPIKGNKQTRIYAQGAIDTFGWNPTTIHLGIFQPRAFHEDGRFRMETIDRAELMDFETDVKEAVERCFAPDALLIPGEKQCRWCNARTICPAREKQALAVVNSSFSHIRQITPETLPDPKAMTPDRIGQILAAKALVNDWFDAIEEEGYRQAMSGVHIPGQKLVQAIGRRTWQGSVDEVSAKLSTITDGVLPAAKFRKETLIGVTECDKLIKPFGKEAMAEYSFLTTKESSGKLQLVADTDSRPAVQPASVAFENVVSLPHIETVKTGETE